jgi:hypothetical protein
MKKLMATALLLTSVASSGVWAHGSHGVVGEDAAKASAARTVQKMTFQDIGFEAGKLDESWQSLKADQIKLVKKDDASYVYAVTNAKSDQTLYVTIMASGAAVEASFNQ